MSIQIEHISKSFYRKEALNDVSFEIPSGEIFGLLGPNGAGKTTLLRIVNGIVQADSGWIRINGELLGRKHLAKIGYMPEERGLYRTMSVYEHALFLGKLRGQTKQDVNQVFNYYLEKFEIQNWRNKRIDSLSKGMSQKVQFICSIIHQPEILFLDEPYSGFDPINIELIKKELLELRKQGKTIVVSTHNMKSVEEICDRVVLIHQSKKILEGRVGTLQQERKKNKYTIRFRGNMISFSTALWTGFEIEGYNNIAKDIYEVSLQPRGQNDFQNLLNTLIGKIEILAAWEILPSMQDIFIDCVQPSIVETQKNEK